MPSAQALGHWHIFICSRNPNVHQGRVPCHEVLVICPKCGSAGDMVVVEFAE